MNGLAAGFLVLLLSGVAAACGSDAKQGDGATEGGNRPTSAEQALAGIRIAPALDVTTTIESRGEPLQEFDGRVFAEPASMEHELVIQRDARTSTIRGRLLRGRYFVQVDQWVDEVAECWLELPSGALSYLTGMSATTTVEGIFSMARRLRSSGPVDLPLVEVLTLLPREARNTLLGLDLGPNPRQPVAAEVRIREGAVELRLEGADLVRSVADIRPVSSGARGHLVGLSVKMQLSSAPVDARRPTRPDPGRVMSEEDLEQRRCGTAV